MFKVYLNGSKYLIDSVVINRDKMEERRRRRRRKRRERERE